MAWLSHDDDGLSLSLSSGGRIDSRTDGWKAQEWARGCSTGVGMEGERGAFSISSGHF